MNQQTHPCSSSETNSNPKRVSRGLKPKGLKHEYRAKCWTTGSLQESRNANEGRRGVTKKEKKETTLTAVPILKTGKKRNANTQCPITMQSPNEPISKLKTLMHHPTLLFIRQNTQNNPPFSLIQTQCTLALHPSSALKLTSPSILSSPNPSQGSSCVSSPLSSAP